MINFQIKYVLWNISKFFQKSKNGKIGFISFGVLWMMIYKMLIRRKNL